MCSTDVCPEVFVNYRTSDEPYAALLIDKWLTERFGRERVFRDSRTIPPGADFPPEIWWALQRCQVLVAVVGPRWLERYPNGRRPLDDPGDYVRREIAEALRRGIVVVPVLVGETPLPTMAVLPHHIAGLATRQHLRLRVRDAEYDLRRLVDELVDLVGGAGLPAEPVLGTGRPDNAGEAGHFFGAPVSAPGSVFGPVYWGR